jgi:hypothetical protein
MVPVPKMRPRNDFPYLQVIPAALYVAQNEYLKSLVEGKAFLPDISSQQSQSVHTETVDDANDMYPKPYHAASIVDYRLEMIRPSKWTNVSQDDGLMRRLIHDYFLYEYQCFPFFQKDYFLDDMIYGTGRFCSPLLVNALLAYAWVSYLSFECYNS